MGPYQKTFTIRWADCDVNGHVRNTAYSEYGVDVRMAVLADVGLPFERFAELGVGPVLLREEIDYLRELKLGQSMTVDVKLLGLSADRSRFRFQHDFTNGEGKLAARIVLEGGWMDMRTRRLAPPPDPIPRAFDGIPKAEGYAELPPRERGPGRP